MIVVKSFKAVDHPRECKTFIEEHTKVLQVFDLANITSANSDWAFSPSSIIVTVRDSETNQMIAGGRIQIADGVLNLPIEDAVGEMDSSIYEVVKNERLLHGTAEVCGLWNTIKAAKLGLGSVFIMRCLLAVASQLNIRSIFTLCAPSTVKSVKKLGGIVVHEIGKDGTFYYPKLDLIATAIKVPDVNSLEYINTEEKKYIQNLRSKPESKTIEVVRKNEIDILYSLVVH